MKAHLTALMLGSMLALAPGLAAPAGAQMMDRPMYGGWQAGWDNDQYDRRHVIVGTVVGFQPYRIDVRRPNGRVQRVDLRNGTVIVPRGATPTPGNRVALVGRYNGGTFIVGRVVLH